MNVAALALAAVAVAAALIVTLRARLSRRMLGVLAARMCSLCETVDGFDRRLMSIGERIDMLGVERLADRMDALDAAASDLAGRVSTLARRREPAEMSDEQRQELAARWVEVICGYCGLAHSGACPRVRTMTTETGVDPHGRPVRTVTHVEFWPNDQWSPPDGAISAEDVWGPGSITAARE